MSKTRRLSILFASVGLLLLAGGMATLVFGQFNPSVAAVPTVIPTAINLIPLPSTLAGTVVNAAGVVADAIVQIQGTAIRTQSAKDGTFQFDNISGTTPVHVTAWAAGHFVGWTTVDPAAPDYAGGSNLTINLNALPTRDNSEYEWYTFEGVDGSAACGMCHREYPEWQADAHSQSATNPRFITMYTGADVNGNEGQMMEWRGDAPVPPDPAKPYYGPGFQLDNPGRAGNCATCHTPMASKEPNNQGCGWSGCHTSLTTERSNGIIGRSAIPINLRGDAAEGISCEFCHKISDVIVDPKTGLPYPDNPGILSMKLSRPKNDSEQVFYGTLVDVTRQDSYLPLLSESRYCASCHFGVFGGVVGMQRVTNGTIIYNSYGEWLESPYSDPETGKSCQDCHMPESDANFTVFPEQEGIPRDYAPMHHHTMPGATDETLLQNSVTLTTTAQLTEDGLQVEVSIYNDKTGHHVPTDAPMRSMILVVEAVDADGNVLELREGSVNPDFSGDYGGVPGKTFAKVLRDDWTGETPTSAFWRPVTIVEDTRLPALATDTTRYVFAAPDGNAVTVNVRLWFRRSFYELAKQKGWNDPDLLMEQETIQVPTN